MTNRRVWTYEETQAAFALYFLIGASKADKKNPDVQKLAKALGRTPDSVAMKLCNIAAHDENRIALGRSGLAHGAKLDQIIWIDYKEGGDEFLDESLASLSRAVEHYDVTFAVSKLFTKGLEELPEGKERTTLVRQRINQHYFRNTLMETYDGACCLTQIAMPELLVASHIKPWRECDPKTERLAASNGLLLNAFHDKAFDQGFMTIDKQFHVRIARCVSHDEAATESLWRYEGTEIRLPRAYPPAREFIEYHNDVVFRG